uniref:HMA domain-containing protein n=1 Tax=Oryza punctata TaxID=4537 RepID=A0A0E0KRQ1_ORYPU
MKLIAFLTGGVVELSQQKIVIKVSMPCGKCRSKAMSLVAGARGVNSVEVTGDGKDRLQVVGDGVDPVCLVTCLRKKIGYAEIVQVEEVKEKKPEPPKKPEEIKKPEPPKPVVYCNPYPPTAPYHHHGPAPVDFCSEPSPSGTCSIMTNRSTSSFCTKQKIVIKACMPCDGCRSKALGVAAKADGVISMAITGDDRDRLEVVGDGVDVTCLVTCLRKKVRYADVLQVEEVKDKKPEEKKPEEKKPEEEKKPPECPCPKPAVPWCPPPCYYPPPAMVVCEEQPSPCSIM